MKFQTHIKIVKAIHWIGGFSLCLLVNYGIVNLFPNSLWWAFLWFPLQLLNSFWFAIFLNAMHGLIRWVLEIPEEAATIYFHCEATDNTSSDNFLQATGKMRFH